MTRSPSLRLCKVTATRHNRTPLTAPHELEIGVKKFYFRIKSNQRNNLFRAYWRVAEMNDRQGAMEVQTIFFLNEEEIVK